MNKSGKSLGSATELVDVALLVGGRSTEHGFSVSMFQNFVEQLSQTNDGQVRITNVVYLSTDGQVYVHEVSEGQPLLSLTNRLQSGEAWTVERLCATFRQSKQFVFSLIQGREGEDGQLQGLAGVLGLNGNFSNVYAAAMGIDKWTSSVLAQEIMSPKVRRIPTMVVRLNELSNGIREAIRQFGDIECVIKPNALNGSLFIRILPRLTEGVLLEYARELQGYDDRFLIQPRLRGREITCGILYIDGIPSALPVAEIKHGGDFFSYNEKYETHGFKIVFPAEEAAIAEIRSASLSLAEWVDFHTMCRIDYILTDSDEIYFLEVNPLPGLLSSSIYPRMLREEGLTLSDFILLSARNDAVYQKRRAEQIRAIQRFRS